MLVVILRRTLERILVRVDDTERLIVAALKVLRYSERKPVVAVCWLECEQVAACLDETIQITHLDLQERKVTQDLDIVRVMTKRTAVALDRLLLDRGRPAIRLRERFGQILPGVLS